MSMTAVELLKSLELIVLGEFPYVESSQGIGKTGKSYIRNTFKKDNYKEVVVFGDLSSKNLVKGKPYKIYFSTDKDSKVTYCLS